MSKQCISLHKTNDVTNLIINLPTSKSESNRALILQYLSKGLVKLQNISKAQDTVTLQNLLSKINEQSVLNCGPAGTTFRFLTAVLAITEGKHTLTGSARMKMRPIKDLVYALSLMGANISYTEKEGYPPLEIIGNSNLDKNTTVSVENSSQYISALLLIGGFIPKGIHIKTKGKLGSKPYVDMTITLLKQAGIEVEQQADVYSIKPTKVIPCTIKIEADWSAASYWYEVLVLSNLETIKLPHLKRQSLQGDAIVADIFTLFGVKTEYTQEGVILHKTNSTINHFEYDFTHCPDLAQTVIVCCAALGITGQFCGLHSLRIKETDRIQALQNELNKFGANLVTEDNTLFTLIPITNWPEKDITIKTYDDHRMAMAFAPLVFKLPKLIIEHPDVVQKSYPSFWKDLENAGVEEGE